MKRDNKKFEAVKVEGLDLSNKPDQTVVVWKATRPLTLHEHEELSAKARIESEQTGLNIMLIPFSVDVGVDDAAK